MHCNAACLQEDAARAYDIAALACKGEGADINYPLSDYREQLQEVAGLTKVGLLIALSLDCTGYKPTSSSFVSSRPAKQAEAVTRPSFLLPREGF